MPKVLIAEDDLMIADMAQDVLVEAGYDVIGIARTVDEGVALALRYEPALAVVDQRLADGGLGTDLAIQLRRMKNESRIGILYATGNASFVMAVGSEGDACLSKPYRAADLVHALMLVEEIAETGDAALPWPAGFKRMNAASPSVLEDFHG